MVELGFELAEARRGRGFATVATQAIAEGFADERVTAVIAHTLPEHDAANRVLEKAGSKERLRRTARASGASRSPVRRPVVSVEGALWPARAGYQLTASYFCFRTDEQLAGACTRSATPAGSVEGQDSAVSPGFVGDQHGQGALLVLLVQGSGERGSAVGIASRRG